jgi:four helix bundle protein
MPRETRIRSFRRLQIWSKVMDLNAGVYRLTTQFPKAEQFGITAQIRRAVVSIAANVAEGSGRTGTTEYARFVGIARGSTAEVDALLELSVRLGFTDDQSTQPLADLCSEVSAMLAGLRRSLTAP